MRHFLRERFNLGLLRLNFRLKRGDKRDKDADVGFQSVDAWVSHVSRAPS
jgi:hypothetical protein